MRLRQPLGDRQAEAGARHLPRKPAIDLLEGLQRAGDVFHPHADAAVAHRDLRPAVIDQPGRDLYLAAGRGELHRVGDQVGQHLAEARGIDADLQCGIGVRHLKRDLLLQRQRRELGDRAADQPSRSRPLQRKLGRSLRQARIVEDVVDQL